MKTKLEEKQVSTASLSYSFFRAGRCAENLSAIEQDAKSAERDVKDALGPLTSILIGKRVENHLSSEKYYSALPMSQMPSINRLSFGDQIHPIHAVPAAPAISEMPSINHSPLADPIRRIHAVFAHADPEGKGYLDVRGFENALQSLGVRLEYKDVLDYFGKEDRGQTGHIEPGQFVPLLTVKKIPMAKLP